MAIVAPPVMVINVLGADFAPTAIQGLTGFFDVRTNFGNWYRLRTFPYPPEGGLMKATNAAPLRTLIEFRGGYTFPK